MDSMASSLRVNASPLTSRGATGRLPVWPVIVVYLALGLWYSIAVPPFETPDEIEHYGFVRRMSQGVSLPDMRYESHGPWSIEGGQAPLYYVLAGRVLSVLDDTDPAPILRVNPRANVGNPLFPGNKNYNLMSSRVLPLDGPNLALHAVRWFSLALGVATVWLIYAISCYAFPASASFPVLVTASVAFIPQFIFGQARVSNDSLANLTATAATFCVVRLLVAPRGRFWWGGWLALGVCTGLATLTKLQCLGLLGLAGFTAAWLAWRDRDLRQLLVGGLLVLGPVVAISGWWYWRNYQLYGNWLATNILGGADASVTQLPNLRWLALALNGARYSFWGLFGWFSIPLPDWIYKTFDLLTLVALAGLALHVVATRAGYASEKRSRVTASETGAATEGGSQPWRPTVWNDAVMLALAVWAAIVVAMLVYWSLFILPPQGRMLHPGMAAFGALFIAGLDAVLGWTPPRRRAALLGLFPAALLACSIYVLMFVFPASYRAPTPVTRIPEQALPAGFTYDNKIEILAAELPAGRYRRGQAPPVTLYVRSRVRLQEDSQLFVQLLRDDGVPIGNVTTHPGWGRNPTSFWEPGAVYADRYSVSIDEDPGSDSPLLARVYVGFTEPGTTQPLPAIARDGSQVLPIAGTIEVAPSRRPELQDLGLQPVDALFADNIRLIGVAHPESLPLDASDELPVTLLWEATGQPDGDYTAFVHVLDAQGNRVTGYDQPPAQGRFSTRLWQTGDRIVSRFHWPLPDGLPAGTYRILVGLYDPQDEGLPRLPVISTTQQLQDRSVVVGSLSVH
jgi:hypothetical protein